ncbi:MAG: hypothetical protein RIR05_1391 [Bacteroidota bacterium]
MWAGLADYAQGHFYEPRFYGQNYNSFFEAFCAIPFYYCGISIPQALALSTATLSLLPYLILAVFLFIQKKIPAAFIALSIAAVFSAEGDILCSIPRGFSPGVFLCSGIAISLLIPNSVPLLCINAVTSSFGVILNPNAWLVYIVLWSFFIIQNKHTIRRLLLLALILICSLFLADVVFNSFYRIHPQYIVYGLTHDWNIKNIPRALNHITDYVLEFGPFRSGAICISILFLLSLYGFYKQAPKLTLVPFLLIAVILLSFSNGKLQEGSIWPYYSYCRFFLPLPFILAACAFVFPQTKRLHNAIACFALLFLAYKSLHFKNLMARLENTQQWVGVHLIPTLKAKDAIHVYSKFCKDFKCDTLLVSNAFWLNTVLAYGGKALHSEFPVCTETRSERRYWVRERLNMQKPKRFLCLSTHSNLDLQANHKVNIKRIDDYGLYLIEQNYLSLAQWSAYLNTHEIQP